MLIVLTGGARSGKSRLAVDWATRQAGDQVVFVATCPRIEGDDELDRRIRDHQAERPAAWSTIEAEHDLAGALRAARDESLVIVDCLTLWVGNRVFRGDDDTTVTRASDEARSVVAGRSGHTVVVTNEVGLGIVPAEPETRAYRDLLGRVNQGWVGDADRALFLAAGRALALQPPAELLP